MVLSINEIFLKFLQETLTANSYVLPVHTLMEWKSYVDPGYGWLELLHILEMSSNKMLIKSTISQENV